MKRLGYAKMLSPRIMLGLLGAVLLSGFGWVVLRHGPMAPVKVTVAQAATADLQPSLFGIGTVEARRAFLIGPTVAGRVKKVLVDVGDRVAAGQLLAEMDPVDLDERAVAARAGAARARNAVAAAQAQLQDAQARGKLARDNAERYAALGRQHFFSPSAVEAKEQESVSAQAALTAARAALDGARDDLARLAAEEGAVARQRANLQLRAPLAGVITARDAEAGTTVVAGQGVLRMVDPTSIWVRTRLDQGRSGGLADGLRASIVLRSRPQQALPGRVARLEPLGDSVTEEKLLGVAFDAAPAGVSLNEMAEVTLLLPGLPGVLAVPNAALHRIGEQEGVWRLKEGRVEFRPVRVGARTLDGKAQILSGLERGEVLVVHSARELQSGDRVAAVDKI
ncbi:MAG: efflux RND transporter periplasmic adaptor subunit [Rhodocyclaceae bacterium]|nr:efflux RND transporter periplasmic adaptor subunit [Rhodocyclaceae bacterium]